MTLNRSFQCTRLSHQVRWRPINLISPGSSQMTRTNPLRTHKFGVNTFAFSCAEKES